MSEDEVTKPTEIGDARYERRGDEKPAPVVVEPDAAEAMVPKVDLSLPKDKVLNIHDSDVQYYKQCESKLEALQKVWDHHRTAGLSWQDVHNELRPIIEKPTAEF